MNSKIFILLVIGFQLIDASIIKKHDFQTILESNDITVNSELGLTYKYNKTFTFDISKTIKVGNSEIKQIDCQGSDEMCEKYGYSFIECTNRAYLKERKSDILCKFSGNKFSNVNVYSKNMMWCTGKVLLVDGISELIPDKCYLELIFAKKVGYNPRDDKKN